MQVAGSTQVERPLRVEVWSDFACPWCALGLARLDAARRAFAHGDDVAVAHRSFELDPRAPARVATPTGGGSMEEAVARKYGIPLQQVRALHDRLQALGAEVGVDFAFGRVQLGSTFDAHRLFQAARGTEHEEALVRALFRARFTDGLQLSDHGDLRSVAVGAGMAEDVIDEVLPSEGYAAEVRADEAAAAALEVTGVPYFLINEKWPVPGAQDVETMTLVFERAWSRLAH